jgi:radical SAM-linked protein
MSRRPDGPPPPPAVQKLRLRYAKRGRLRFSSHRDFQRALERALRRAAIPMAYSAGFNPHPKVSYANAAPTGAASEAEYVEISVTQRCDPEQVRAVLDEGLPTGLDVVDVVEVTAGALADRLEASEWEIVLPDVTPERAAEAAAAFTAADVVEVQRMTKNGVRTFDARPSVVRLESVAARHAEGAQGPCAILRAVIRHGTTLNALPSVRPDDVITGLRLVAGLALTATPAVTRLAQGPLDEDTVSVGDPLAADRANALG